MDIIILGGGIIGLTIANLLAENADLQIALIEQRAPQTTWNEYEYDLRCSAITRTSQQVFMHLGVWQEIIQQRVGVYEKIVVWEQPHKARMDFNAAAIAQPNLGHIVENRVIARSLYTKLLQTANVRIINSAITEIESSTEFNRVYIDDYYLDCKLLIGADGRNSWLRNKLNIPTYAWGHEHSAIVAVVKTQLPHSNTAWQRFMSTGPIAFLPLDHANLCSIVWASSNDNVAHLMQLTPAEFSERLAKDFNFMLGCVVLHGARANFPVSMLHASKYTQGRNVLIGDAVHALHPLAGQGLNLGIVDALGLAEIIKEARMQHKDIGDFAVLRKYERARKAYNMGMLALITGLQSLFAMEHISTLRNQSLQMLNSFNWCKNKMMRFALGV